MIDLKTILSTLFAFYLLVFCNFTKEILGCRLQTFFDNSMIAKHVLSFLLLFALVVMASPENADTRIIYLIIEALVIYTIFIMTARTPLPIMMIILFILGTVYILNSTKKRNEEQENIATVEKISKIQTYLAGIAVVLIIIGFVIYMIEKQREYGNKFTLGKFIFGNLSCRKYTPPKAKIIP